MASSRRMIQDSRVLEDTKGKRNDSAAKSIQDGNVHLRLWLPNGTRDNCQQVEQVTMKRANRQENCDPEIVYDIRQNIDAIIEWIRYSLRGVQQDQAKRQMGWNAWITRSRASGSKDWAQCSVLVLLDQAVFL